ncbi:MAG: RNA-protein complex protein Nop10 [Candidatus Woesearchaeota archaeon]
MAEHIHKCNSCNTYTMEEKCPLCLIDAPRPLPPKFSPEDKYGNYRREVKKEDLKSKNMY